MYLLLRSSLIFITFSQHICEIGDLLFLKRHQCKGNAVELLLSRTLWFLCAQTLLVSSTQDAGNSRLVSA